MTIHACDSDLGGLTDVGEASAGIPLPSEDSRGSVKNPPCAAVGPVGRPGTHYPPRRDARDLSSTCTLTAETLRNEAIEKDRRNLMRKVFGRQINPSGRNPTSCRVHPTEQEHPGDAALKVCTDLAGRARTVNQVAPKLAVLSLLV
jgi:hypothetical protein